MVTPLLIISAVCRSSSSSTPPSYDEALAGKMTALGAPSFACTPDLFPTLMATAIQRRDIAAWVASHDVVIRG